MAAAKPLLTEKQDKPKGEGGGGKIGIIGVIGGIGKSE